MMSELSIETSVPVQFEEVGEVQAPSVSETCPGGTPAGAESDLGAKVEPPNTPHRLDVVNPPVRPLVSVEEAGRILGLSRATMYRSIRKGDLPLPVLRISGRWRIPRAALDRLAAGADRSEQNR